jgi:hypothetical protein
MLIVILCALTSACAHRSVYQNWADSLRDLPGRNGRVQDVSIIVGREHSEDYQRKQTVTSKKKP